MIKKSLFILISLTVYASVITAQKKATPIQRFIANPNLKHASIGICIKDFSGKNIASYDASKSLVPASILKVVTTGTALETLGGDYRFRTTLARDRNNPKRLLIHGYGDPTLGTAFLDNDPDAFLAQWGDTIQKIFDTSQPIDIVIIDNYWGYEGVSQRWIREDLGIYYGSGSYGISVYDNTYKLNLSTATRGDTCPIVVNTEPEMNIRFINTLRYSDTTEDSTYIFGEPLSDVRTLVGTVPKKKSSFSIKGDIPNPGLYLGQVLAKRLRQQGFNVNKVETSHDLYQQEMFAKEKTTFDEDIFYTHYSFPLKEIIRDVNVRSNNHYAEHLMRAVGRTQSKNIYSSPLKLGIAKTNDLWKSRGIDTDALFMYDGSGLSPSNAVSPEFMCDLLLNMKNKSESYDVFLNSFGRAGKDGTVRNVLKGTRLEGKVYIKSGSIAFVQCYAGYYIDGDKKYAFAVMVNKFNSPRNQVVKAIESLLLEVF